MVLAAGLDGQRGTVAALTILALLFTIGGLIWGGGELRAEYRKLDWQWRGIQILLASEMPEDEKKLHMEMVLPPSSSWNDVSYLKELIRLNVLEQASDSLKAPLLLTLLGVVLGSGASVWSLWL
ncbi:hypothetical protein ACWEBX_16970 [Streptomyces sp. NPDC005070]